MKTLEDEALLMGMEAETFAAEVFRAAGAREDIVSDALDVARAVLETLAERHLIELWVAHPASPGTRIESRKLEVGTLLSRTDWIFNSTGEDGLSLVYETTSKGEELVRQRLGWLGSQG